MNSKWVGMAFLAALACGAFASPITFNFKDDKGVNTATFKLDAVLEAVNGSANGISGEILFDPAAPSATKGKIVVDTSSLHVPNPMMKQHLHGKDWMDVATFTNLVFEAESMSGVKTTGDVTTADVSGKLTIKGVTKPVTVPVKLTYLKGKLAARTFGRVQGDLLVLRSNFTINRSDFGINPKAPAENVADEIQISLSVAGAAPKS